MITFIYADLPFLPHPPNSQPFVLDSQILLPSSCLSLWRRERERELALERQRGNTELRAGKGGCGRKRENPCGPGVLENSLWFDMSDVWRSFG